MVMHGVCTGNISGVTFRDFGQASNMLEKLILYYFYVEELIPHVAMASSLSLLG
jgi:hypothetical protein